MEYLGKEIEQFWQDSVSDNFCEFIQIQAKSPNFDSDWQSNGFLQQACLHVESWVKQHGPSNVITEILAAKGRTPLLYIEIPGNDDETLLFYGHLDKQPESEGWDQGFGPWEPVIKNGYMYGRGCVDDGYAVYSVITALRVLSDQGIQHKRAVMLLECSEESGSFDLEYYLKFLQPRLAKTSLVVCVDSGCADYKRLWLTTSLRGIVSFSCKVTVSDDAIHSGVAGGIVPSSMMIMRSLLSRLEDESNGNIRITSAHASIPEHRIQEARRSAAIVGEFYRTMPIKNSTMPLSDNIDDLIINKSWKPALEVIAADGIPSLATGGNVIRPFTEFSCSLRLPPSVEPQQVIEEIMGIMQHNPPFNAIVEITPHDLVHGWHAPRLSQWLEDCLSSGSQMYFGNDYQSIGEGGSIGFMGMMAEYFPNADFIVTGVLGPDGNAHGPNERLNISAAQKITGVIAHILSNSAKNMN